MKTMFLVCLVLFSIALLPTALLAQRAEIHPYAGGFWPRTNDEVGKFKSDGIYGAKAGVFVGDKFELGGNFGYINHFEPSSSSVISANNAVAGISNNPIRAYTYEATADYNFTAHNLMGRAVTPYVSVGAGGLTTEIDNGTSAVFATGVSTIAGRSLVTGARVLEDNDTFFTFTYGGGVKALQLWGPMGLRADVRGRTIPNFFGKATNWPEVTGGLTFSWGER